MKRFALLLTVSLVLLHPAAVLAKGGHGHGHGRHGRHRHGHAFFGTPWVWPYPSWQPWAAGVPAEDLWCVEQHYLGQRPPACEGPGRVGPPTPPLPPPGPPPLESSPPSS